ncbi:lytic transglycosylase domain-containing protein, partial [Amylibacter sp.]|nr:lytic transglycosylase domain-containing protein [Amylibacter sp.]
HSAFDTCQALRDVSRTHGLDAGFFTRLIWQESRFDPNALSPAGAQGIAQFMPQTAKLRGLSASYNPALALDHSAQYLAELTRRFGNVGLAAVAYNGGETRAQNFVAKTNGLAQETIDYVQIITGQTAEDWRDTTPKTLNLALDPTKSFMQSCLILAKKRRVSKLKSLNPKPKLPLWGIQMATGSTRAKAKARYTRNARDCRTVIDGRKPNYIKKSPQVAGRKDYYVARLGAKSRGTAQKLCNRLRKFNCVCVVYKN